MQHRCSFGVQFLRGLESFASHLPWFPAYAHCWAPALLEHIMPQRTQHDVQHSRLPKECADKGHLKLCEFLSKLNTKHGHYSCMQPLRLEHIGQQWGMASPSLLMELVKAWLPAAGQASTRKPEFASYSCGVTKRNTLIGQPMSRSQTSWARQESTKE